MKIMWDHGENLRSVWKPPIIEFSQYISRSEKLNFMQPRKFTKNWQFCRRYKLICKNCLRSSSWIWEQFMTLIHTCLFWLLNYKFYVSLSSCCLVFKRNAAQVKEEFSLLLDYLLVPIINKGFFCNSFWQVCFEYNIHASMILIWKINFQILSVDKYCI